MICEEYVSMSALAFLYSSDSVPYCAWANCAMISISAPMAPSSSGDEAGLMVLLSCWSCGYCWASC